jgi:hypothetical protein
VDDAALREAVGRGEAPAQHLAMPEDRVAVTERLDERRATVGLEPLAVHLARWS